MTHRIAIAALAAAAAGGAIMAWLPSGPARSQERPVGSADGYVATGRTISLRSRVPAVTKLDPALRRALTRAAAAARRDGIELRVSSGWRSPRYQRMLLDAAVSRYGSLQAARRYVNTPERSAHVRGQAVDVGPTSADYWLIQHGVAYGLCQIYANEIWHFELAAEPGGTCPAPLADASAG
jgi:zinc D-Ala-D-Ala carboxypeptidase